MKAILSVFLVVGLAVQGFTAERPPLSSGVAGQEKESAQNEPPRLAEGYLFRLAKTKRSRRTTRGVVGGIVGASSMGLGIAALNEEEDWLGLNRFFGTFFLVGGGLTLAGATITLVAPTRAEREYASIRDIQDSMEREQASATALAQLAKSGRTSRMITGGLLSAVAVLPAAAGEDNSSDDLYTAVSIGGLALYSFLVKSPEETAYLGYQEGKRQNIGPEVLIGLAPRGGICVSLSVEF